MSWPGGRRGHKRLPPAGFKKGLPGTRPARNQTLREQLGQENRVAKNTSQWGGLRSFLPGAEF